MKIKDLKISGNTVSVYVNGQYFIGSFENYGGYCGVTYLRNVNKQKQTTLRIKCAVGFAIDKMIMSK